MNSQTQIKLIKEQDERLIEIFGAKGNDYSTAKGELEGDCLDNFKRLSAAAQALNINTQSPISYSLFMCLMKIDRINNLLTSGKTPENESVEGSYDDLLGYAKLSYCLYIENTTDVETPL